MQTLKSAEKHEVSSSEVVRPYMESVIPTPSKKQFIVPRRCDRVQSMFSQGIPFYTSLENPGVGLSINMVQDYRITGLQENCPGLG